MVLWIVLGVVFTAMAAGQLASWLEMPAILGEYEMLPEAGLPWLAGAVVVGELICGVWFLVRPRSHALVPVWAYTAVSLVWAILGVQGFVRGLSVENCGCFGVYLTQRLSWFVLVQDGLLLVYAAVMARSGLRDRADAPERGEVADR